jgi:DNA-binding MarR family transcriptional regulator
LLVRRTSGLEMDAFALVAALILFAGGAGGFASYLLQPPERETRSIWGAMRFIAAGAIVALAVPLFLSLAQSALIKSLFDTAAGDQRFQNALVLVGFCVVAGFASRRFMDSLAARMMQVEHVAQKAEEKSEKAKETSEEAVELVEENIDRVAEVRGSSGRDAAKKQRVKPAPMSAEIEELATNLRPEERAVVTAVASQDARTFTGISRDAKLPRKTVKAVVPRLVEKGVLRYTTSANTGGSRVQLTPIGAGVLNSGGTDYFVDRIPGADATEIETKTHDETEVKSGN